MIFNDLHDYRRIFLTWCSVIVLLSAARFAVAGESSANFPFSLNSGFGVNTYTGEVALTLPIFHIPGPMPLQIEVYYGSMFQQGGIPASTMGENWRHSFDWRLNIVGAEAQVLTAKGQKIVFTDDGTDYQLSSPLHTPFQLITSGSDFKFYNPESRYIYLFVPSGVADDYRLLTISDGKGNVQTLSYTPEGRLGSVTDGLSRTFNFFYMGNGKLNSILAVNDSRSAIFSYNFSGQLISYQHPGFEISTFIYDADESLGPLLSQVTLPRLNNLFSATYNAQGQAITQTDGVGSIYSFNYVSGVTTITQPDLSTQVHQYDGSGALTGVVGEDATTFVVNYDLLGRPIEMTDRMGNVSTLEYDAVAGLLSSFNEAGLRETQFAYAPRVIGGISFFDLTQTTLPDGTTLNSTFDSFGNLIAFLDQEAKQWIYTHNILGQVLTETNPTGGVTTYVYDLNGILQSMTDHAGNTTLYTFDGANQPDMITFADTENQDYNFSNSSQLATFSNENSVYFQFFRDENRNLNEFFADSFTISTLFARDNNDRIIKVTDRLGGETDYSYNPRGWVENTVDRSGIGVDYGHDLRGNLTDVTDVDNNILTLGYNANSNLTGISTPLADTYLLERDALGRQTAITTPMGLRTEITYDANGNVSQILNPQSIPTNLNYNPRELLEDVTHGNVDPLTSSYTYNDLGQPSTYTDPNGGVWTMGYDAQGRIISDTDPLGRTSTCTYNNRNRISSVIPPGGLPTTSYTYDPVGNLSSVSSSLGTAFYGYDDLNQVTNGGFTSLTYDNEGRVIITNTNANNITTGYDAEGRIISVTVQAGKTVNYTYDTRGLLATLSDWAGNIINFSHDAAGRMTVMDRSNGVTTDITYDADDRMTKISNVHNGTLTLQEITGNYTQNKLTSQSITGAIDIVLDLPPGSVRTYDAANQITDFQYDGLGRRTEDSRYIYGRNELGYVKTLLPNGTKSQVPKSADCTSFFDIYPDGFGYPIYVAENANFITPMRLYWNFAFFPPRISMVDEGGQFSYPIWFPDGTLSHVITPGGTEFMSPDFFGNVSLVMDEAGAILRQHRFTPEGKKISTDNLGLFGFNAAEGWMNSPFCGLMIAGRDYYDIETAKRISEAGIRPYPSLFEQSKTVLPDSNVDISSVFEEVRIPELSDNYYPKLELSHAMLFARGLYGDGDQVDLVSPYNKIYSQFQTRMDLELNDKMSAFLVRETDSPPALKVDFPLIIPGTLPNFATPLINQPAATDFAPVVQSGALTPRRVFQGEGHFANKGELIVSAERMFGIGIGLGASSPKPVTPSESPYSISIVDSLFGAPLVEPGAPNSIFGTLDERRYEPRVRFRF